MRMFFVGVCYGLFMAAIVAGILLLVQSIVQAFAPDWSLPFSLWWSLIFALPGFAWGVFASQIERHF